MEWDVTPLDNLFFRGSEPFNRGESVFLRSVFPPTPQTVQGFVRTAILEANCYDIGLYSRELCATCPRHKDCRVPEAIGGPSEKEKPGKLRLRGPYVVWSDNQQHRRVYVAPRDLVSRQQEQREYLRLAPGEALECDLGRVRFADTEDGVSVCEWVTEQGLEAYLEGNLPGPKEIVHGQSYPEELDRNVLWDAEAKTGIARNRQTRAAQEHMLYSIEMVRLRPGVSLGVRVSGIDGELESRVSGVHRFGGEGHLVSVSVRPETPLAPPQNLAHAVDASGRFRLVSLQPCDFNGGWLPPGFQAVHQDDKTVWQGSLNGFRLSLVSACLGKAERIGGWDMAKRAPSPVKACVPAGTVYYFQSNPGQGHDIVESLHDANIGARSAFGFGHVAVGCWNEA